MPKTLVKRMVLEASEGFFESQKWPQEAPRRLPRCPQDAPKTPSTHPQTHQDAFQAAQNAPPRPKTLAQRTKPFPNKRASRLLLLRFLKNAEKPWFLQGFWLFGLQKRRRPQKWARKGGHPKVSAGPPQSYGHHPKLTGRPGGPQEAPRGSQESPKRAPGAPGPPPGAPKTPPRGFPDAPDCPPASSELHFLM